MSRCRPAMWGVGHRTEKGLAAMGIKTALALAEMDIRLARRLYGVTLERTIRELRGEACLAEEGTGAKQQLVVSVRLEHGSRNWRRCSRR